MTGKRYLIDFMFDSADNDFKEFEQELLQADSEEQAVEMLDDKYQGIDILAVLQID